MALSQKQITQLAKEQERLNKLYLHLLKNLNSIVTRGTHYENNRRPHRVR